MSIWGAGSLYDELFSDHAEQHLIPLMHGVVICLPTALVWLQTIWPAGSLPAGGAVDDALAAALHLATASCRAPRS